MQTRHVKDVRGNVIE